MKLSDFFVPEAVIPELQATDRNGVIRELTASLASATGLDEAQAAAISKAVIARENQGSTGFGKGVAVPHVKHPAVKRIMATVGRSSTGVDFAALDRAPVYIVVLLLSPPDNPDQHLASMENIFRHLQRDNFRRFLRQASTKEEINDNIREADELPGG
ncbi:MAG: PTS sugar transporter subunit IIA [Phycisphaerae bacterium]|jgi:mannitol/fructose-specific phosphotransferase system IIA component (Ntr-type)|nr:PTS sugar transporter subunit IIA [Phycisphaerae bacterium]